MTPAPQAAVDAAMETTGCARVPVNWDSLDFHQQSNWVTSGQPIAFGDYCFEHRRDWTDDGTCQAARDVAAAVVAAVQGPIKAEALRQAAVEIDTATQSWNRNEGASIIPDPWGDPALRVPLPDWLRARADRIEAQP